jgi:hypothetical protein
MVRRLRDLQISSTPAPQAPLSKTSIHVDHLPPSVTFIHSRTNLQPCKVDFASFRLDLMRAAVSMGSVPPYLWSAAVSTWISRAASSRLICSGMQLVDATIAFRCLPMTTIDNQSHVLGLSFAKLFGSMSTSP